eukprot:SAG25_NODE_5975_length_600_cov_0.720559_2_plen_48_part_00
MLEVGVRRLCADRRDRLADESERRLVVARTDMSFTENQDVAGVGRNL